MGTYKAFVSACVLAAGFFVIDLQVPLGVAGGVPYVAVVLLGWWFPQKMQIVGIAALACLLTVVGYILSPEGGEFWIVLTNRGLALFAILVTAGLLILANDAKLALVAAKEEAERADNAKSEFLSSVSHELRTPLNAILGFAQLLRSDSDYPLSEKQTDNADTIIQAGDHLLRLIDDILDLAQIEAGKAAIHPEPQVPTAAIRNCAVIAQNLAAQKGLEFFDRTKGWTLPVLNIDETRFQQVLLNFLSNAVKYNRDGGRVTLAVEETRDRMLRLSVADYGIGIAEKKQKLIFTPFSRLGLENSDITGTGIGLSITRELVEAMAGRIGFDSRPNVGSTFGMEFPIVSGMAVPAAGGAVDTGTSVAMSGHTVLCVEDNPSSLKLLEAIIDRIPNTTMISAHTGELGINLTEIHRPDVVLMDINLPGINGLEALARLKKSPMTRDIPVIALTARASPRDIRQGLDNGFSHYLTKPINVAEVTDAISSLFPA